MNKQFFRYFLVAFVALAFVACSDDNDDETSTLDIDYASVGGVWQLTTMNGFELPDSLYVYMELDRIEHTFVTVDNLNSMYGVDKVGFYSIEGDDYEGYTLEGYYDYTGEDIKTRIIESVTETTLTLVLESDTTEVSVFTKRDEIPSDVYTPVDED